MNQTYPSIHPLMDTIDRDEYREVVMENIGYEKLLGEYGPEDTNGMVELILDVLTTSQPKVRIGKEDVPTEIVRSRFLKLDDSHIEYVFDCLRQNTTKIRNIRSYLLTSLYNAPVTIGQHYQTKVSHDFYGGS